VLFAVSLLANPCARLYTRKLSRCELSHSPSFLLARVFPMSSPPFAEAQRNEPQEIQKLIDGGLDPSVANGVGQTALHVACLWGRHKCVEVLIKAGAKVS